MNYSAMIKQNKATVFFPLLILILYTGVPTTSVAQDKIPVREYTNPEEVVTFDRNTSFPRALDIINEFAQENVGKIILDRTGTDAALGMSIPPMHWRDALDLILRVKGLVLIEQRDFFEIVDRPQPGAGQVQQAATTSTGQQQQEGILATTSSREVRINAIFFEGNRRALKEIGVDWATLTESTPANLNDFIGSNANEEIPSTTGFDNQFVAVSSKGAQSVSQSVFSSLVNFGEIGTSGIEVQALFSAFEADNLGEVLASPSVKVMDGQEGRIQVGQEFSIKQRDFAGNVTDQFFDVGTILTVTPTVLTQNDTTFIHLDIQAERSSAQPDPVSTIVNKQEATTQAILMDGEATSIAGLYRSESAEVRRGIPLLKDLPPWFFGLRYLFGYNSVDRQLSELVILIQAELEPSISDRFGRKHANKFQLLSQERRRIRDEIAEREKYAPTSSLDREGESTEQDQTMEDSLDTGEISSYEELEEEQEQPEEEAAEEPQSDTESDQLVMDPEVDSEPVPLDLGTEDEMEPQETDSAAVSDDEEQQITAADDTDADETAEEEPQEETADESMEQQDESAAGGDFEMNYYIVGGSFANESNAVEYQEELKSEGFDAVLLTNPESGIHYVAYRGFDDLDLAKTGLIDIREYYNADAWMYKTKAE